MPILIPDLVWRDDAFQPGLVIECDDRTGRIVRVVHRVELDNDAQALADQSLINLPGRALVPGFVNAHSHAFQRLIRGRTQWKRAGSDGDETANFWTWRDAMYNVALRLTPEDVYDTARFCFVEMLRAGITCVGEFHYLHNDEAGQPYDDRAELARRVVAAAEDVGIRIRLLNVCYASAGIGAQLRPEQRRFATTGLDAFIHTTSTLHRDLADSPLASVGIAPHSIRAVPRDWLPVLQAAAAVEHLPLHMHVSEQPAEVEACLTAFGLRPVQLLNTLGLLDDRFTAVHATHINDSEVIMLAAGGATVCACPATERDLGDGYLRAADLLQAGGTIALGTDSQTVIDMLGEARLIEYTERCRRLERVVLTRLTTTAAHADERYEVAPALLDMATIAGAQSLHIPAGVLEAGMLADVAAIDLNHHVLAGWTADTLPALLALSAAPDVISDVWVGGRQVITHRTHGVQEDAVRRFNSVAHRIPSA